MTSPPWKLLTTAAVAIAVGVVSAWPLAAAPDYLRAAGHAAVLFAAIVLFFGYLPRRLQLPGQVFAAMAGGVALGWAAEALGSGAFISDYLGIFGTLFLLLLKLVITPLIFVSVLCGVAGIGDARRLGALGGRTIVYFMATTALAVAAGMLLVQLIDPGAGRASLKETIAAGQADETAADATASLNVGQRIQQQVLPGIIQNPIMAGQNPLVVIFFALILGAALAAIGKTGLPALEVFRALDAALITIIGWVMVLAPIGVLALIARVVAELGVEYVITLAKYCVTVLLGLALHFTVVSCLLVPLLGGVSPRRFLRSMLPAIQLSFSTSSSAATLPVTLACAQDAGADRDVANFVLPIGATINMDGTSLYVAIASIFIAQVYGVPLGFQQEALIFLTAIAVSVGTAGIPGASVGLITIVLASSGIPVEGLAMVVGVDRILDMSRTTVNITGDAAGAVILSRGVRAEAALENSCQSP